ncbi:extracellular solute-binding protein [Pseudactinotalea sp.]|uniref:extracellular solute-binding protein n=1 Tax=Pseudactinotalea sp. TaxID=1926260 RepID=UPI003B3B5AB7
MTTTRLSRRSLLQLTGLGIGASVLTACGGGSPEGGGSPTGEPSREYFWSGRPMVLGDEPFVVAKAKELFDLDLTTVSVAYDDYGTRLQSLLVGGDIPDLMWVANPDEVQKFAQQGVLGEVSRETIAEHAPTLSSAIDELWPQGWNYQFTHGANFGIPTYFSGGRWSSSSMWRGDLLDEAGITQTPTTIEEAESAFAALKEIGVIGMTSLGASDFAAFHTIFGSFGVMPTAWQMVDGRIINGAVRDEAREALELLSSWYAAGYIDPEFSTTEGGAQAARLTSGEVAFMDYVAANARDESDPNSAVNVARSTNPDARLDAVRALEGSGGRGAWSWGSAGNSYCFSADLAQDPGRVAAALEAFEAIYADTATSILFAAGEEGTHYELVDPDAGLEGGITYLGDYTDKARRDAEGFGPYPYFGIPQADVSTFLHTPDPELRAQQDAVASDGIVDYFGKATSVPGAGASWANLTNLKVTAYTEFITGSRSLSDWDGFVAEWNANGGEQLQVAAQQLADELG